MSVANFMDYVTRIDGDPELKARAAEIGRENLPGQIELARSMGLDFSEEDVRAVAEREGKSGELSEDDLETVAGGLAVATAIAATSLGVGVTSGVNSKADFW